MRTIPLINKAWVIARIWGIGEHEVRVDRDADREHAVSPQRAEQVRIGVCGAWDPRESKEQKTESKKQKAENRSHVCVEECKTGI